MCPWRWIIKLSRGEICSSTCWALVQSHQHNMDYVSSAVCSMTMNWFIMRLCHFLVSLYHSRYKDGLIWLLDQFFCSYFIGFWVMQCTGGDPHFPCLSAKEENVLGQLHYLLNSLIRCKVVFQTAEKEVLLMEVFWFLLLKIYLTKAVIVWAWSLPKRVRLLLVWGGFLSTF